MLIPLSWLKDYVLLTEDEEKIAEKLLLSGTKVEEITVSINQDIDQQRESFVEITQSIETIAEATKESALNVQEAATGISEITRSAAEGSTTDSIGQFEGRSGVESLEQLYTHSTCFSTDLSVSLGHFSALIGFLSESFHSAK